MISVKNLTKTFGDRTAIHNVSFHVRKGEILGLLGPNGAGKTTIMRIITGYLPPTDGTVMIDGMDIFKYPWDIKKRIGYMPEQPPLYLDMTVQECLGFVAEIHGSRGSMIQKSIASIADLCGIGHMLGRLTGNLSKGYRQRVGLAQALIHEPDILILDEPTSGLDPGQIIEIRDLIKNLGSEKTVILSSHILPEVTNICKRIAILNNGSVMAIDSIDRLSHKLGRDRQITVKVRRPESLDLSRIASINGVLSAEAISENEFSLLISGEDSLLEALSSEIVSMKAGLVEIKSESMSLEDIFLEVITGDRKA